MTFQNYYSESMTQKTLNKFQWQTCTTNTFYFIDSPSCHTLSKAFDKSKNIPPTSRGGLKSKDAYISCTNDRSWNSGKSHGLNPNWFSLSKLFSWRSLNNELKRSISRILKNIGKSETEFVAAFFNLENVEGEHRY